MAVSRGPAGNSSNHQDIQDSNAFLPWITLCGTCLFTTCIFWLIHFVCLWRDFMRNYKIHFFKIGFLRSFKGLCIVSLEALNLKLFLICLIDILCFVTNLNFLTCHNPCSTWPNAQELWVGIFIFSMCSVYPPLLFI